MPRPVALRGEILRVMRTCRQGERNPLDDRDVFSLEPRDLFRVIRHQSDARNVEEFKHSRRDREIARLDGKAEAKIGIDRIMALVLESVGAQLVDETDSAPFLPQI